MVGGQSVRIAFFGTSEFAVPTLEALHQSPRQVVVVVTQPDRPRGRGYRISEPPVKVQAVALGLPVLQPARLDDPAFLSAFVHSAPDLGVVAAYGKILNEVVLATPRLGLINVHASLLPRYRGAAPIHRAIMNGEEETGITIVRMVKALDAGPILAMCRRPIGPDETSEEVERDLARLGAAVLLQTVDALSAGSVEEMPQDETVATYAPRLRREDGLVDWQLPAADIHNRIRGLHPWPRASTLCRGRRLILLRSVLVTSGREHSPEGMSQPVSPNAPGTILEAHGDRLMIATGRGVLAITELQAEGTRPMSVREFLAGHRLSVGERLTSPT
jgi:methionyl-tRNA formyltransferase